MGRTSSSSSKQENKIDDRPKRESSMKAAVALGGGGPRAGPKSKTKQGYVVKSEPKMKQVIVAGSKAAEKKTVPQKRKKGRKVKVAKKAKEDDEEKEYEVEKVIGVKYVGSANEYLVLWKGYKQPTWEPEANLKRTWDLVTEFIETLHK